MSSCSSAATLSADAASVGRLGVPARVAVGGVPGACNGAHECTYRRYGEPYVQETYLLQEVLLRCQAVGD